MRLCQPAARVEPSRQQRGLSLAYNPPDESRGRERHATRRARSRDAMSSSTCKGGAPPGCAAFFCAQTPARAPLSTSGNRLRQMARKGAAASTGRAKKTGSPSVGKAGLQFRYQLIAPPPALAAAINTFYLIETDAERVDEMLPAYSAQLVLVVRGRVLLAYAGGRTASLTGVALNAPQLRSAACAQTMSRWSRGSRGGWGAVSTRRSPTCMTPSPSRRASCNGLRAASSGSRQRRRSSATVRSAPRCY